MTEFFTPEQADEVRASSLRYLEAVAEKHPALAIFLPDVPPEIFDPYPLPTSIDQIARWVAHKHKTNLQLLRGSRRTADVAAVRHEAFYLCRQWLPKVSYSMIGSYFGDRDTSTVQNGIRRHMKAHNLPQPERASWVV